jgi:hypothetical protein
MIKKTLQEKPPVPQALQQSLFDAAELLLSARREAIHHRESLAHRRHQARVRRFDGIRAMGRRFGEVSTFQPQLPAALATAFVLALALFATQGGSRHTAIQLGYSDLPALPKSNDAPRLYDAQILADRQAYEREVENAHRETSGGI